MSKTNREFIYELLTKRGLSPEVADDTVTKLSKTSHFNTMEDSTLEYRLNNDVYYYTYINSIILYIIKIYHSTIFDKYLKLFMNELNYEENKQQLASKNSNNNHIIFENFFGKAMLDDIDQIGNLTIYKGPDKKYEQLTITMKDGTEYIKRTPIEEKQDVIGKTIGLGITYKDYSYKYDECNYDNLLSVLQCGVLDSCRCGLSGENVEFIRDGLKLIQEGIDTDTKLFNVWNNKCNEFFGKETSKYFFFYIMDTLGLTEHGSSVPGWLTENGKKFIELADIALGDNEFDIFEKE